MLEFLNHINLLHEAILSKEECFVPREHLILKDSASSGDETFAQYLSANDGEECKDLFANHTVMIDLSQQVWKRRDLLDFLQQKPSAVLDEDSEPEVSKQFAQFEEKLFGLLKE